MTGSIKVTGKEIVVPPRTVSIGKYRMIYAAALGAMALPAATVVFAGFRNSPGLAEGMMLLVALIALGWGLVDALRCAVAGSKLASEKTVSTRVSIEIPQLDEGPALASFLESRTLIFEKHLSGIGKILARAFVPSYQFLPVAKRKLLREFGVTPYLWCLGIIFLPYLLSRLGVEAVSPAAMPWLAGLAFLAGIGALGFMIRLTDDSRPLLNIELTRVHNESSGNPTSFFFALEDLLQDLGSTEFRNHVYRRVEPQVGRTQSGETNVFHAELLAETYPRNLEFEALAPALFSLRFGYAMALLGFFVGLYASLLWQPSFYNALVAGGTFYLCTWMGKEFCAAGENLIHTYRFASHVFRVTMKGTYGSSIIDSDPTATVKGRRSMLDSEVRCEIWSCRLISESINRPGEITGRYLIDARSSPDHDEIVERALSQLRTSQLLDGRSRPAQS